MLSMLSVASISKAKGKERAERINEVYMIDKTFEEQLKCPGFLGRNEGQFCTWCGTNHTLTFELLKERFIDKQVVERDYIKVSPVIVEELKKGISFAGKLIIENNILEAVRDDSFIDKQKVREIIKKNRDNHRIGRDAPIEREGDNIDRAMHDGAVHAINQIEKELGL